MEAQSVKLSAVLLASGINQSAFKLNTSLFSSSLHLPRYPSQSVCTDYATKCAAFIAIANQPALLPDCNASVPYSATKKFPSFSQVVGTVRIPLTPVNDLDSTVRVSINLRSDPNYFTQADDQGYSTMCPEGTYIRMNYSPAQPPQPLFRYLLCSALPCTALYLSLSLSHTHTHTHIPLFFFISQALWFRRIH